MKYKHIYTPISASIISFMLCNCSSYIGTYKSEQYEENCQSVYALKLAKSMSIQVDKTHKILYEADDINLQDYLLPPINNKLALPNYRHTTKTAPSTTYNNIISNLNKFKYTILDSNKELHYVFFETDKSRVYKIQIEDHDTGSIIYLLNSKNKILLTSTLPKLYDNLT